MRSFRQPIVIPHCRSLNPFSRSLLFLPLLPPSLCFSKAQVLENELRNDYSHDSGSFCSESYFDRHSLTTVGRQKRRDTVQLNPLSTICTIASKGFFTGIFFSYFGNQDKGPLLGVPIIPRQGGSETTEGGLRSGGNSRWVSLFLPGLNGNFLSN